MKVFKIIYYVFLGAIILIAVLLVWSALPMKNGPKVFIVQSGSMEPAIKTGGVVVVKSVSDYKVGDVITFGPYSKTKAPTTHRIYEMKAVGGEPVYITKGDANNAPDTREISKKDVVGKVLLDVPYVGYAVAAAKTPIGFMLIIIIPAAIIVYDEIRKIWGEIGKMKKNKKDKKQDKEIGKLEEEVKKIEKKISL
jgi:signal peptidase